MNIFHFPRGRSRELSTRTTRPIPLSSSTGPRQRGERALLNTALERRFNRSPLSRSSLLSSFAIPNSSFVVNALERRGREPSITSKRRRRRNNFPPWRYVKLWFSSIERKGRGRRKEKARSILWELNSPLSFERGEDISWSIDFGKITFIFNVHAKRKMLYVDKKNERSFSIHNCSNKLYDRVELRNRPDWLIGKEIIFTRIFVSSMVFLTYTNSKRPICI